MTRRHLIGPAIFVGMIAFTLFGFQWFLTAWLPRVIQKQIPLSVSMGSRRWSWPLGVTINDLVVLQPRISEQPYLLKAEEMILQVPGWGIFVRPVPLEVTLVRPHVIPTPEAADLIAPLFLSRVEEAGWVRVPVAAEKEEGIQGRGAEKTPSVPAPGLFLMGLHIIDGKVNFPEIQADPNAPALILANLKLEAKLSAAFFRPVITLKAAGDFVAASGEKIGFTSAESVTDPVAGNMEGRLQIWHERLSDFRTVYQYAPEPFFFEAGKGGPIIEWKIRNKEEIWASMRSLLDGLRIEGTVRGVPWNRILKTLENPPGKIDITVTARGNLNDPDLDVHDQLLSELDWIIKEKAAAAGVDIPGRIFFGLDPTEEAQ